VGFEKKDQWKQLKAKKRLKPNRQPKPARRKDWRPGNDVDFDEADDFEAYERVMPRGEHERRRMLTLAMAQVETEVESDQSQEEALPASEGPGRSRGIVVEVSSGLCRVNLSDRDLICEQRGSLSAEATGFTNVVAVGDEVMIQVDGTGWGIVEEVLPRRSVLARPDVYYSHLQQVIGVSHDQQVIVASWRNPAFWLELVDRYPIAAERNKVTPLICINKLDLAECRAVLAPYQALCYQVILASALNGQGIDQLCKVLQGRITALAGLSGVGKSSLLTAVQPDLQLRTGLVSEASGEGRHTTPQVTMLPLARGGFVVDTPGIREFGLHGLAKKELIHFYPDLAAPAANCRFTDCSHRHEPGCAVKEAVTAGTLPAIRMKVIKKFMRLWLEKLQS
jgi:ribosome biogenesis GTPase